MTLLDRATRLSAPTLSTLPGIPWSNAPALSVVLLTALLLLMRQITGPIDPGSGLGDASQYAKLVMGLRTGELTAPEAPFVYRIFPAGLVALSGLDPWLGFLALNTAAILGTGLFLAIRAARVSKRHVGARH